MVVPIASCAPVLAPGSETYLGFSVGMYGAPPPPRVVFTQQPALDLIEGSDVYVVAGTGYDMFECDGGWYLSYGGYWYRAPSYAGPFVAVDVRRVPQRVLTVPHERWKHDPRGQGWYSHRDRGRRGHGDQDQDDDHWH